MKALCISAAIALALSGAAFAKGGSKSSAGADVSGGASAQISAADCGILTVQSAKAACLRSAQANAGSRSDAAVGASSSESATGVVPGGPKSGGADAGAKASGQRY